MFVSYSGYWKDCSWFVKCDLERLQTDVAHFMTAQVRVAVGAPMGPAQPSPPPSCNTFSKGSVARGAQARQGTLVSSETSRRLVIASHMTRGGTLSQTLKSLRHIGFPHFPSTLVVLGGAGACDVQLLPLSLLLHCAHQDRLQQCAKAELGRDMPSQVGDLNITVIWTEVDLKDYTGLHALWQQRKHPLVSSQSYMYILDSVTFFDTRFLDAFAREFPLHPQGPHLYSPPIPNSNTGLIFGRHLMRKVSGHYGRLGPNMSKHEAFLTEDSSKRSRYWPLTSFGNVSWLEDRVRVNGLYDAYGTGPCAVTIKATSSLMLMAAVTVCSWG